MVPDEYFCMENPTIFKKKLIRVNGTKWSVLLHGKSNNFQKKAYKGQWYQVGINWKIMLSSEYFCMENSTIFRKMLIRVNGTRWSVFQVIPHFMKENHYYF